MKKTLLALAVFCGAVLAVSAADYAAIDLNFYSADGTIAVEGKLPEGVTMPKKIRFHNPKLTGYAFPIRINREKTQAIDLKLKVRGEGKLIPSVFAVTDPKRPGCELECSEFEFCGIANDKTPFTFKKWTSLGSNPPFVAEDGETITIKAKFKTVK